MKAALIGIVAGLVGAVAASMAAAEPLPAPSDKPILEVSGTIENTNADATAQFDAAMLESLGMVSFKTKTPWDDGTVEFEGVRMDKLMEYVGAEGDQVQAIALNDYSIEIPVADFAEHGPILALKRNGEYMPVSDKGPLFIVYPFDSDAELQSQTYYGRSVWQVAKLIVE
jgi:hypothetical protein